MKIKQLLPIAMLAVMMTPATFAANTDQQELSFGISPYINITNVTVPANATSTTTIGDDYSSLTLANELIPQFKVVTNWDGDAVQFKAEAAISGGNTPALGGTDYKTPIIAFTNSTHLPPNATAVTQAIAGNSTTSPNAIAFQFTWDEAGCCDDTTPATIKNTPTIDTTNGVIKYLLKNGIYNFKYTTVSKTAFSNSFSTHDQDGTYKATVIMSQTTI